MKSRIGTARLLSRLLLLVGAVVVLGIVVIRHVDPFTIRAHHETPVSFSAPDGFRSGTLYHPAVVGAAPVVVVVHGDGPSDRTAGGALAFYINALLDRGIAVYSYDKAGIGASSGNWLEQSMADRARELKAAVAALNGTPDVGPIGVLAFSQGGWVVSELAALGAYEPVATALIGVAVDWMDQRTHGVALEARRRDLHGTAARAFQDRYRRVDDAIADGDYERYRALHAALEIEEEVLDPERYAFVQRNMTADSRGTIERIEGPVLVLLGAADTVVDVEQTRRVYREELARRGTGDHRIAIIPDGDHGLVRSDIPQEELLWEAVVHGDGIMAAGALETLSGWFARRFGVTTER